MDFQWDENKAGSNFDKHGIDFADAVGAFDDPMLSPLMIPIQMNSDL
jgi:uncharacterized DUF497 family protein